MIKFDSIYLLFLLAIPMFFLGALLGALVFGCVGVILSLMLGIHSFSDQDAFVHLLSFIGSWTGAFLASIGTIIATCAELIRKPNDNS